MSRDRQPKPPPIVAELGRPETPAETATRKAENSRVHRQAQTTRNLVVALFASLGLVLVLVLVVARPDSSNLPEVDYRAEAAAAERVSGETIALPALPETWKSNRADIRRGSVDGSWVWYLGMITPGEHYIAVQQAFGEDERWLGDRGATIGGVEWTIVDRRDARDTGNFAYALWTETDSGFALIHGTATDAEFTEIAAAVAARLLD